MEVYPSQQNGDSLTVYVEYSGFWRAQTIMLSKQNFAGIVRTA
jgi:hypothetical protein